MPEKRQGISAMGGESGKGGAVFLPLGYEAMVVCISVIRGEAYIGSAFTAGHF
jgi:hypothetical protein